MKVSNGRWKISSRDLFKEPCEHCTRIDMAVAAKVPEVLERVEPFKEDLTKVVYVVQGNEFEAYVFEQLRQQLGQDLVELKNATMQQTLELMNAGTPVVAQGFLETEIGDHLWSGYPDLIIRDDFSFENGRIVKVKEPTKTPKYVVWDVKASKDPDEKYWLQVASYSKVLDEHNLGSTDDLGIIAKHFQTKRLPRLEALSRLDHATNVLLSRLALATPSTIDVSFIKDWHCGTVSYCKDNFCDAPNHCRYSFEQEHSLHILYGNNPVKKMHEAGINNYDDLLANADPQWEKSRTWARLLKTELEGNKPYFELTPKQQWKEIPTPTAQDLFFDIEWFTPVLEETELIFEFGFVDAKEQFTSLDGFTKQDELPNFKKFVELAMAKMHADPLARIYHYSNPETTYLQKLADRYGILQDEVHFLISRMVDLRKVASSMILPGANGYSIKQLERYYDADVKLNRKANGVSGGADAMFLFYQATVLDQANAEDYMNVIRAYNKDDCLSTKLLRDWLLTL